MKLIPEKVTRSFGRQILSAKKSSPHILFAAGVVGVIGATVLACKATLKLPPVVKNFEDELEECKKDDGLADQEIYIWTKNVGEIAKLYAPAVGVGALSLAALTGSHIQLTRRNAALTAAYALVSTAFTNYRARVVNAVGAERELDIYHAATPLSVEDQLALGTDVTKMVDPSKWSAYARIFDEYSIYWTKDAEINRIFVRCQENHANELLRARGHVLLNDVYDMLGLERTKAGTVVGWVISKGDGDNFIDFGLYEATASRFLNGLERSVVLDFNVDGVIYDKI